MKKNEQLLIKLDQSLSQNRPLAEQIRQLTKALYGSKFEKSKYQAPDGQGALYLKMIRPLAILSIQKNKARQRLHINVVRKLHKKKRNKRMGAMLI